MTFTSISFSLFFALVFTVWYVAPLAQRWIVMLAASAGFCLLAAPATLVALAAGVLVAWTGGRASAGVQAPGVRRAWVAGSTALLVTMLALPRLVLVGPSGEEGVPAGIVGGGPGAIAVLGASFFTLKLIAYVVDTFARRIEPEPSLWRFAAFAGMFLELPAGPIDRAQGLLPQLVRPQRFSFRVAVNGTQLVLWGLFKKLVVADRLAPFVAYAYDEPAGKPGISLVLGTVLFAFQLLADFSAYSDIAIGLGLCLGLDLGRNFDAPYSARSIGEFWRRWHITFSSWLRDYVFLPVNYRVARWLEGRRLLGLGEEHWGYAAGAFVTMALGGLWHGNGWHFIAWGLVLAMFMTASVLTRKPRARLVKAVGLKSRPRLHHTLQVATTFSLVCIAWVFFRAPSLSKATLVLTHAGAGLGDYSLLAWRVLILGQAGSGLAAPWLLGQSVTSALVAGAFLVVMVVVEHLRSRPRGQEVWLGIPGPVQFAVCLVLALVAVVFCSVSQQGFVYAGF